MSGITYYTNFLGQALAQSNSVSIVLMRRLIPRRLYPGRDRVGTPITELSTSFAPTFDGIDWFAIPSVPRALRFVRRQRPQLVIFEWWSGSVLPWYLILSWVARRDGSRVIIELHEDLDTAEASIPVVGAALRRGMRHLLASADAYVVHSDWDKARLVSSLHLPADRVDVIRHGPFPMASPVEDAFSADDDKSGDEHDSTVNILFFGTIRPYKGLEVLVQAFDLLPRDSGRRWRLTVVGETWEGWTLPLELIHASPHRMDISLVNRYVTDDEIPAFFADADVVALPYLRSSASGPLHLTMSAGLPVVVTSVGGLEEAAAEYSGSVMVEPNNPTALAEGIVMASTGPQSARGHVDPHSWDNVGKLYTALIERALKSPIKERK